MPDPKKMEEYVNSVVDKISKGEVKDLESIERRLGEKLRDAKDDSRHSEENIRELLNSVQQANKRIKELEKEHSDAISKAAGIMESMLVWKYGEELDKEAKKRQSNSRRRTRAKKKTKKRGVKKAKRSKPSRRTS